VANPRLHATTQRVVNEAFAEEKPHLKILPLAPFRSVLKLERRVSHEGMVSVGGNLYSVPDATRTSLDRNRILALAQLDFIDHNEVIHFLGPPGTGKSHLATALGVETVKAGQSVYFASLADIISALANAEREGQLRERIRFLCRTSLLIGQNRLPACHPWRRQSVLPTRECPLRTRRHDPHLQSRLRRMGRSFWRPRCRHGLARSPASPRCGHPN
jgi:hypothetical protein